MKNKKELEKILMEVCGTYENDCSKCPRKKECNEYISREDTNSEYFKGEEVGQLKVGDMVIVHISVNGKEIKTTEHGKIKEVVEINGKTGIHYGENNNFCPFSSFSPVTVSFQRI